MRVAHGLVYSATPPSPSHQLEWLFWPLAYLPMSRRIIPVTAIHAIPALTHAAQASAGDMLTDILARPLRDLRISVTDRCNFRCAYCMPRTVFDKNYAFLPHNALLSLEEIVRLARLFVAHGVKKIRITGGEPLLRKNLEFLIEQLARLSAQDGQPLDLSLTTNGSLLARKARSLKNAGLSRVTVSLDALDDALFKRMNDADFSSANVLDGIAAAQAAGLGPVKVNMVIKRGTNDTEILPMARHFKGTHIVLRFIEYMDVGASNGWSMAEVMPSAEVLARIAAHFPLAPLEPHSPAETAQRWGYVDGSGEIGLISSVTRAFCGNCARARLSTEGKLYLCLFSSSGYDLRSLLHNGASDATLTAAIAEIWRTRADRYSQLRGHANAALTNPAKRVEMSYIGG